MPKQLAKLDGYKELLFQVKKVFIEGLQRIEQEKVKAYWTTGRLISDHILKNKTRADYATKLYEQLAVDLNIDKRTLQRSVRFYRYFPIAASWPQLSWSHYRLLSTIKDKDKRNALAKDAIQREWSAERLQEIIRLKNLKYEEPKEKIAQAKIGSGLKPLPTTRSRLFTYQVLEPSYIHPEEEFCVVDLGFKFNIKANVGAYGHTPLRAGDIIESIKSKDKYSFKKSDAKPKELYTYKALVERVVDADTIWLNVDVGFSCWSRQKVRLRGIDTPELSTEEGKRAKEFVEARLKEVDFIVIKTYNEPDKYERYLADVFYLKGEEDPQKVLEQGMFLNQELLDNGLAKMWDE